MKLLFDANSFLNMALLRGVDHDHGRVVTGEDGKEVQVNSAQYGVDGFWDKFERAIDHFDAAPRQCALVWDGENAKAMRKSYLPGYKAGRDKAPEVNEQLNLARGVVTQMALHLGCHVIKQDLVEADDVIGYLVAQLRDETNIVVSNDGDLSVLVDDNTGVWDGENLNRNPCGPFAHKYIRLYKTLVGDTTDKIPGAKGFGDAAWIKLVRVFGYDGLDTMIDLIKNGTLGTLAEDVADLPELKTIINDQVGVNNSWFCASLHPERVNTMRRPLGIQPGMVAQWKDLPDELRVHGLKRYYGTTTLVTAENYAQVYDRFARAVGDSPFVALDIETSSDDESDEWIDKVNTISEKTRSNKIDVLGHEITGMGITFGANTQHTIYMSVDHKDTDNITVDQCREMVELIPQSLHTVIQNRQFEFSVLYRTWGEKWKDNGWHGFVPNAVDSTIGASYINENERVGLKDRSKLHLGYKQATYEETTTKSGPVGSLSGGQIKKTWDVVVTPATYAEKIVETVDPETGEVTRAAVQGRMLTKPVTEAWESRQYRMNELTALEVLGYGADDPICTAALHTHYQFVMQMEGTWNTYLTVETLPEYLTSLAFVQGIKINLETLRRMREADDKVYEESWKVLREFLMKNGWDGTSCPEFEGDIEPSDVKLAASLILDGDFTTKKRKLVGIAMDMREQFPDTGGLLAAIVENNDVEALNHLVRQSFDGEPKINFGSPKQMQNLFYRVIRMTPRIINKLTEKQRDDDTLRAATKKFREIKDGKERAYTSEEYDALISKASTDDDAVETALAKDELTDEQRKVLLAYQAVRSISTLRGLYYKPYPVMTHWRDGRIHPNLNQCATVTRRHSSSAPNIQQLVKGAGGFREVIVAPHTDWVVCSMDLAGQELRLAAEVSGDVNMTSCYVGDKKKDMHHLTAVSAAPLIWGQEITYDELVEMLSSKDPEVKDRAKALRANAKTVNFATAYGAMAPKIALTLMTTEEIAQAFIDAKEKAFPRLPLWAEEVQDLANELGYTKTLLGARRHLADGLQQESKWDRMKAERQAGNFIIQGSGGEMIRLAMAEMWRRGLFTGRFRAQFYAPVHDEVVFTVHREDLIPLLREAHPCMIQQYADMNIPLESSISIGHTFGTQIELGVTIDEDLINTTLKDLFP